MSKERAAQLVDAGIWLRLSGDIEGARRLFERALKLDPENQRASDLLAQAPTTVVEPPAQAPSPIPVIPSVGGAEPEWRTGGAERPAASASGIAEDWGRMTGRGSPPPQSSVQPPEPGLARLGEGPAGATGVMFSPGRGSPAPLAPRAPSPPPISPSTPAPPSIAPVTPVPSLGSLVRTTLPYAGHPSPSPSGLAPGPRQTMMFTTDPTAGIGPPRQTLPFGGPEPVPSAPRLAAPQLESPAPRTTLPYSSQSPVPRGTFPPLESTDSELGGPPRSTQVFSHSTAGPLAPSEMPEVRPMVIHIETETEEAGPDELVESLREQVNAGAVRGPRATSIVITDTAPEPAGPAATPPLFPESPELPVATSQASAARAASGIDAAWNWSASPPPAARGLPSDEGMPTPRPSPGLAPQASSGWDQRGTPGIKIDDMIGPDNALEFVSTGSNLTRSPEADREEVETLLRGARDLIDLDDHTGAMELISRAQALAPDDPQVQQLRERSERTLLAMFESKLGHLDKVPRVMLKDDEIIWLNLDHRAGFVLAQIDGTVSFEDLFAVSGMSRLDTARILAQLVDEGVISRG